MLIKNVNCKWFESCNHLHFFYGKCQHEKMKRKLYFFKRDCLLLDPNCICNLQEKYPRPKGLPSAPPPAPKVINEGISIKEHGKVNLKVDTFDRIQGVRSENNKNWMNLMRLAFKYAPEEAKEIMKDISKCDQEVTKLTKELAN